jgi:hypothetical protein
LLATEANETLNVHIQSRSRCQCLHLELEQLPPLGAKAQSSQEEVQREILELFVLAESVGSWFFFSPRTLIGFG